MTGTPDSEEQPSRGAGLAILLSFLWPGLGQWRERRLRAGLIFFVPITIVAVAMALRVAGDPAAFAIQLIDPDIALALLVLVVVLAAWRIASLVEAGYATDRWRTFRGRVGVLAGVLITLVLATHGLVAGYAWSFYQAGNEIFVSGPNPTPLPSGQPQPTDVYLATPFATPKSASDRITILLTGIDHNVDRTHSLTDTLLIVTFDPESGATAMISFPRDIARFPMYDGGTYGSKINSLMTYVANHPERFPDGPLPTLARQLGYLLGIPIHYYAAVDLDGFEHLIDVAGGVDIEVKRRIADGRYDWLDGSPLGFYLAAGKHHLNGRIALAFARSRQGVNDNDFVRADRQQQLLLALRKKLLDPGMLPKLPELLDAAADTIRTNFPPDRIDEMFAKLRTFEAADIERFVLQPPTYSVHPPTRTTNNTYILILHMDAVAALSVRLFGEDSAYWTGTFDPAGSPVPGAYPSPASG